MAEVENRLSNAGWAWVRGRGASGKTVLGSLIALDRGGPLRPKELLDREADKPPPLKGPPAYYLDLGRIVESGSDSKAHLRDVISTRADTGVLFVIDNVHRDDELASDLFEDWRRVGNGSHWLMLSRFRERGPHHRGTRRPLDPWKPEALELSITSADLLGVYRRLARRRTATAMEPPAHVLNEWTQLFGGDLIAFSAAVMGRLERLTRGDWRLGPSDARTYVRDEYLDGNAEETNRQLLKLAAMTSLELTTPEEAVERGPVQQFLDRGIALGSSHGRSRYRRYGLIHPGLGDLFLAAAGSDVDSTEILMEVALTSAFCAPLIAIALEAEDRAEDARTLLKEATEQPGGLVSVSTGGGTGLIHTVGNIRLLVRLGVSTLGHVDDTSEQYAEEWADSTLQTPLGHLPSFLAYARKNLPRVNDIVAEALESSGNRTELNENVLCTQLHLLVHFLTYTKEHLPRVYNVAVEALRSEDNAERLTTTALQTPLSDLPKFLDYAHANLPEVHSTVVSALGSEPRMSQFAEEAAATSLGHLTSFLRYATKELPDVYAGLVRALGSEDNSRMVAETALYEPVDKVAPFFRYSREHCKDLGKAVAKQISTERWHEARGKRRAQPQEAQGFASFARELEYLGRVDLAPGTAEWIISTVEPERLPSRFHLRNLCTLLFYGRNADPQTIKEFIRKVVTKDWLCQHYQEAKPGSIAWSLFTIWQYHPSLLLSFHHPELLHRLRRQLLVLHWNVGEELLGVLRLLGVADLIRVPIPRVPIQWPDSRELASALESEEPEEEESIRYVQSHLWLGLRTMARFRDDQVCVPANYGDRILELWGEAEPESERSQIFNDWMIRWLEDCAHADWKLVPDNNRFEVFETSWRAAQVRRDRSAD